VHTAAIVVAAGRGTRMGAPAAKAFLPLAGRPLAVYALRTLSAVPEIISIVLVVGADCTAHAAELLAAHGPWPHPVRVASGGAERQDSVAAGLAAVDEGADLVLVHDAARPFVSHRCIERCIAAAADAGAAIAAVPVHDTVKLVADASVTGAGVTDASVTDASVIERTLDRRRLWLAQTPQVFRTALLRRAYEQARRDGYTATDDAALVERLGVPVRVVEGDPDNRKLTTPDDLQWAEWYVQRRRAD
jgi:2-C-methyl-D-erythritol 4-phosphate cytidylyltransferase